MLAHNLSDCTCKVFSYRELFDAFISWSTMQKLSDSEDYIIELENGYLNERKW